MTELFITPLETLVFQVSALAEPDTLTFDLWYHFNSVVVFVLFFDLLAPEIYCRLTVFLLVLIVFIVIVWTALCADEFF